LAQKITESGFEARLSGQYSDSASESTKQKKSFYHDRSRSNLHTSSKSVFLGSIYLNNDDSQQTSRSPKLYSYSNCTIIVTAIHSPPLERIDFIMYYETKFPRLIRRRFLIPSLATFTFMNRFVVRYSSHVQLSCRPDLFLFINSSKVSLIRPSEPSF
jgi:hypothetical protein